MKPVSKFRWTAECCEQSSNTLLYLSNRLLLHSLGGVSALSEQTGEDFTFQENCRDILLQVSNFDLRQSKSPSIHPKAVIRLQVQKGCPQPPSTAPSSPSHLPPTGYNLKARPRVYNPPVVSDFRASLIAYEWLMGEAYPPGHPCTSADDGEQAASTVDQPPGPLV